MKAAVLAFQKYRNRNSFNNVLFASVRDEARHEREVLREQHRDPVRQGPHRGLGRGQAAALRVVQRLREGDHQAAHQSLRPRGGRAQLQR